jgi:mevalonate kinase
MPISFDRPDTAPGQRPVVATSCGKLILLGEHAVVYGEPALAVPLHDLRFSVVLNTADAPWAMAEPESAAPASGRSEQFALDDFADTAVFPIYPADPPMDETSGDEEEQDLPTLREDRTLALSGPPPLSVDVGEDAPSGAETDVARALAATARALGLPVPLPLRIAVRSGGLRSGMGTSAAMGVALSRALLLFYGQQPSLAAVLRGAEAVERLFHGNPSGVDHTVAAGERPVWFVKGKPPRQLAKLPGLDIVILPRLSEHATADVVSGVRDRLADDPSLARAIAAIGRWSREGRIAWTEGRLKDLAAAMSSQQAELDRLGVVLDSDRSAVARALDSGALAAKITGAGCGGSLFALVTDESAAAVMEAWGPTALRARVGSVSD